MAKQMRSSSDPLLEGEMQNKSNDKLSLHTSQPGQTSKTNDKAYRRDAEKDEFPVTGVKVHSLWRNEATKTESTQTL